jgi:hypothetical protein
MMTYGMMTSGVVGPRPMWISLRNRICQTPAIAPSHRLPSSEIPIGCSARPGPESREGVGFVIPRPIAGVLRRTLPRPSNHPIRVTQDGAVSNVPRYPFGHEACLLLRRLITACRLP